MNKTIIALFSGIAVGSWITYAIIKDHYKKRSDEEIASMRQHYINRLLALENDNKKEEKTESTSDAIQTETSIDFDNFKKDMADYKDYTSLYSPKKESEPKAEALNNDEYLPNDEDEDKKEDEEDDYTNYIPTYPREGPSNELKSITPEEFNNEYPWWDKVTLLYYPEDLTVLTESEEVVEDMDFNLIEQDMGKYEEDVVYIRDEQRNIDYEVHRMEGHFSEYMGD